MQPDEMQDEMPVESGDERGGMTPLDPAQLQLLRVRAALIAVPAALAAWMLDLSLGKALPIPPLVMPAAVLLLALLLVLVYPARRYRRWGYREGEDEIEIQHGNLVRVRTIVPFGRVQHIDVAQGPIDRKSTRLNSSHVVTSRMPSSA